MGTQLLPGTQAFWTGSRGLMSLCRDRGLGLHCSSHEHVSLGLRASDRRASGLQTLCRNSAEQELLRKRLLVLSTPRGARTGLRWIRTPATPALTSCVQVRA